ncbi:MAG: citryl-CoA lyase [Deltaproteobacteria bacterium]
MEEKKKGWWDTTIIEVKPNKISIKGYPIQDLMGRVSYGEMLYLMIMGELPGPIAGKLVEAVLVAACDQGVISPAITVSRMAATCGVTFNSAIASGMNLLGRIHGGAIEEAMEIFYKLVAQADETQKSIKETALEMCAEFKAARKFVPGYGHPVHKEDPRTTRLWQMAAAAVKEGEISGKYVEAANAIYEAMKELTGKHLTINIDASAAAILCELGVPSQTSSGFISLSRGLGLLAHAYEEISSGRRMKAAMPPNILSEQMTYSGPEPRDLPAERKRLP